MAPCIRQFPRGSKKLAMERNRNIRNFANAYNCKRCPGNNGPKGCPEWIEYVEQDEKGMQRITEECGRQAWPKWMGHVLSAANRPAAAIENTRNALIETLNGMGAAIERRVAAAVDSGLQISGTIAPQLSIATSNNEEPRHAGPICTEASPTRTPNTPNCTVT
jgi:hypothetical protein